MTFTDAKKWLLQSFFAPMDFPRIDDRQLTPPQHPTTSLRSTIIDNRSLEDEQTSPSKNPSYSSQIQQLEHLYGVHSHDALESLSDNFDSVISSIFDRHFQDILQPNVDFSQMMQSNCTVSSTLLPDGSSSREEIIVFNDGTREVIRTHCDASRHCETVRQFLSCNGTLL